MEYTSLVYYVFMIARQIFFSKRKAGSPRGFLPRPLLPRGRVHRPASFTPENSGGAHHFRFRFLDLCIRFGKIISKACPVGNLFSFGVCESFNSGATKLDTNSFFEDEKVRSPSPAIGGAGFLRVPPWRDALAEMEADFNTFGGIQFFLFKN